MSNPAHIDRLDVLATVEFNRAIKADLNEFDLAELVKRLVEESEQRTKRRTRTNEPPGPLVYCDMLDDWIENWRWRFDDGRS